MTRTGRTLTEYMKMGAAGKVALLSFINHLPQDSALRFEMDPKNESTEWFTTLKTNKILADLFNSALDFFCVIAAGCSGISTLFGKR